MFKLIQTHIIITTLLSTGLMVVGINIGANVFGSTVHADHEKTVVECHEDYKDEEEGLKECVEHSKESVCDEDETQVSVAIEGERCLPRGGKDLLSTYVQWIIKFLTGGVGLVIALMITVSGVQYVMAGSNPEMVQKAKSRLKNAIFALLLFIFLSTILNYLVPGGLL